MDERDFAELIGVFVRNSETVTRLFSISMLRRFILCLFLCALVSPAPAQTLQREFAQADAAWDKRDYAAAEAHFDSALKLVGDDENAEAHAYFGRGAMRLQQKKWASARDDLTRSIDLNSNNPEAFASRGMASKGLGDYTSLLADAHHAAQLDPDYAGFEDDAKSTVNWKRAMLGFIVLACILGAVGFVPMVRSLAHIIKGEAQGRAKDAKE